MAYDPTNVFLPVPEIRGVGWVSVGQIRGSAGSCFFWSLWEAACFLAFSGFWRQPASLASHPSIFEAQSEQQSLPQDAIFGLTLLPASPPHKGLCDYTEPTQIIQNILEVS